MYAEGQFVQLSLQMHHFCERKPCDTTLVAPLLLQKLHANKFIASCCCITLAADVARTFENSLRFCLQLVAELRFAWTRIPSYLQELCEKTETFYCFTWNKSRHFSAAKRHFLRSDLLASPRGCFSPIDVFVFIPQICKTTCERELAANQSQSQAVNI